MDAEIDRRRFLSSLGMSAGLLALGPSVSMADLPATDLDVLVGPDGVDWAKVRESFLLGDGIAYFNCGSLGPSPMFVLREMWQAWETLERNPVAEGYGPLLTRADEVRIKAADFLGCAGAEIAVTQNTTEGMSAVAQGIDWQAGDRVLTTDQEHPGGLVGWQYVARKRGVTIDTVQLPLQPRSADEIVGQVRAALTKRTRVISLSHVTFTTGLRLPVAAIADVARAHGCLLVVDGAQAPGGLVVDVKQLGCDAYATSAHKWLLAPMGTGLLYISKDARDRIDPLLLAGGPRVYTGQTGTRNLPSIIGLGAALDFLARLGKPTVEKRLAELRAALVDGLSGVPGVKIASPSAGPFASPLVTVGLPAATRNTVVAGNLQRNHRVIVKVLSDRPPNAIRLSPHVYTSAEDIAKLVGALGILSK